MYTASLIRASLSSVRKELAEVFPRITDDMLGWAPTKGMRTIRGQFEEILFTEMQIIDRIKPPPRRSNEEIDRELADIKSVSGFVAKLDEVRQATLHEIDTRNEIGLIAPAEVSEGFANWLDLNPVPVAELFRYIARHEYYHTGQLVSYLWARGDDPYKWA